MLVTLLMNGRASQAFVGDAPRLFQVLLEHLGLALGEAAVVDVEVRFVVQPEERSSKFVEPTEVMRPSTIITLQWYMVGWYS